MYCVGIFMLYYLSRTRENLADTFSAQRVEGRHLASALVKIAYGIVKVEDVVEHMLAGLTAPLDGKILGTLGQSGHDVKQFNWIHSLACPSENELLVADMNNWRVQKLTLHPDKSATATAANNR